jgi:hypothetical protein
MRLFALLNSLVAGALLAIGVYVYTYRSHLHTSDPTSYHLSDLICAAIVIPSVIALVISVPLIFKRTVKKDATKSVAD